MKMLEKIIKEAKENYEPLVQVINSEKEGIHRYYAGGKNIPLTQNEYAVLLHEIKKRTVQYEKSTEFFGLLEFEEADETLRVQYNAGTQHITILLIKLSSTKDYLYHFLDKKTNTIHFSTWNDKCLCGISMSDEHIKNRKMVDLKWYINNVKTMDEKLCKICKIKAKDLLNNEELFLNKSNDGELDEELSKRLKTREEVFPIMSQSSKIQQNQTYCPGDTSRSIKGDSSMKIGARLSTALLSLNIKNKDLVNNFHISQQYASNLKKAENMNDTIAKIAYFYKINLNWLFAGEGEVLIKNELDDKEFYMPSSDMLIPDYLMIEINALFKRAIHREKDLMVAIDDFVDTQKKLYKGTCSNAVTTT